MTFSRRDAVSFGWDKMKPNLSAFLVLSMISFLISGIHGSLRQYPGHLWLASLSLQLVHVGVTMAWTKAALLSHDGTRASSQNLVPTMQPFFNYAVAGAIYGLMVAVGMILLVVPGVLLALRYCLFPFLILDQNLDAIAALKRSAQLTEGVRGELFVFGLLLMVLNLLGALAFGIGLFATLPTSAVAAAYVYRRLLERAGAASNAASHVITDPATTTS